MTFNQFFRFNRTLAGAGMAFMATAATPALANTHAPIPASQVQGDWELKISPVCNPNMMPLQISNFVVAGQKSGIQSQVQSSFVCIASERDSKKIRQALGYGNMRIPVYYALASKDSSGNAVPDQVTVQALQNDIEHNLGGVTPGIFVSKDSMPVLIGKDPRIPAINQTNAWQVPSFLRQVETAGVFDRTLSPEQAAIVKQRKVAAEKRKMAVLAKKQQEQVAKQQKIATTFVAEVKAAADNSPTFHKAVGWVQAIGADLHAGQAEINRKNQIAALKQAGDASNIVMATKYSLSIDNDVRISPTAHLPGGMMHLANATTVDFTTHLYEAQMARQAAAQQQPAKTKSVKPATKQIVQIEPKAEQSTPVEKIKAAEPKVTKTKTVAPKAEVVSVQKAKPVKAEAAQQVADKAQPAKKRIFVSADKVALELISQAKSEAQVDKIIADRLAGKIKGRYVYAKQSYADKVQKNRGIFAQKLPQQSTTKNVADQQTEQKIQQRAAAIATRDAAILKDEQAKIRAGQDHVAEVTNTIVHTQILRRNDVRIQTAQAAAEAKKQNAQITTDAASPAGNAVAAIPGITMVKTRTVSQADAASVDQQTEQAYKIAEQAYAEANAVPKLDAQQVTHVAHTITLSAPVVDASAQPTVEPSAKLAATEQAITVAVHQKMIEQTIKQEAAQIAGKLQGLEAATVQAFEQQMDAHFAATAQQARVVATAAVDKANDKIEMADKGANIAAVEKAHINTAPQVELSEQDKADHAAIRKAQPSLASSLFYVADMAANKTMHAFTETKQYVGNISAKSVETAGDALIAAFGIAAAGVVVLYRRRKPVSDKQKDLNSDALQDSLPPMINAEHQEPLFIEAMEKGALADLASSSIVPTDKDQYITMLLSENKTLRDRQAEMQKELDTVHDLIARSIIEGSGPSVRSIQQRPKAHMASPAGE